MDPTDTPPPVAPPHAELGTALSALRLGVQPSDLHGSLTGYLCAGAPASADDWLDRLELAPDSAAVAHDPLLRALYDHGCAQFAGARTGVEPLLPTPQLPLPVRADALVEWCRGFLGGFGLAGATARAPLSADATEVLADFGTIAASHFDYDDDIEDAQAFADVLAFVRTATALLHREVQRSIRHASRRLH
jgi:uncharacterized protein